MAKRDLWLVVTQWPAAAVDTGDVRTVAIGPWPSKARRAIAATAWNHTPSVRSVRTFAGRPRSADEYIAPKLTKAERNALERRREEQPCG